MRRIRRVVMFACPNNGSEFFLQIRRGFDPWGNRQESELRPISEQVLEAQRRVIMGIVHAGTLAPDRCPIPLVTYAAASDNIVTHASAASIFADAFVLPGTHRSIIRPKSREDRSYIAIKSNLARALDEPFPISQSDLQLPSTIELRDQIYELRSDAPIHVPISEGRTIRCTLHAGPVEQPQNIDILVIPENIYFQMAHFFKPSISGRIRLAAADRTAGGEILDDTAQNELTVWIQNNGRLGLPVPAGSIAVTSSGNLSSQGISHLFHAAITEPDVENNHYIVKSGTIGTAVHKIFALAKETRQNDTSVDSICFPLLGSGQGGLDPSTSFNLIWDALKAEVAGDSVDWKIHFITWKAEQIQLVRARLNEKLVIDVRLTTEGVIYDERT